MRDEPSPTYLHIPPKFLYRRYPLETLIKWHLFIRVYGCSIAILVSRYIKYWLMQYELFWCFPMIVGAGNLHFHQNVDWIGEIYNGRGF